MTMASVKINMRDYMEDIIAKAVTDREAFGRLYDAYYDRIYRFCISRVYCRWAAEDVTSGVFLKAAENINRFNGSTEAQFRAWIYRIAANEANGYLRKKHRREKLLKSAAEYLESARHSDKQDGEYIEWTKLHGAILELKPHYQTAVTLRFFEEMEYDQIAEIMNKKPATVRVDVHRAVKKINNILTKSKAGA